MPVRELTLTIEDLDDEGAGVGTDPERSGGRVHVRGGLPGEKLRVKVEHQSPHKAAAWASIVKPEGPPSPDRREPLCPGDCKRAGCVWSHVKYPRQLEGKRHRLRKALAAASIEAEAPPVLAAPAEVGYRNRAKLVIGGRRGRLVLGGYEPASHTLVDMAGCKVPEPAVAALLPIIGRALEATGLSVYDEKLRQGELRYLVLRGNHEGKVLALLVLAKASNEDLLRRTAERLMGERPELAGFVLQENASMGGAILGGAERVLAGTGELEDRVGDVTLALSASAFFQANRAQAARLYAHVAAELGDAARVVELYAGVGGITLGLAAAGRQAVGVEVAPEAVADAMRAAQRSSSTARFLVGEAASGLSEAAAVLGGVDAVVVDPPRKGLTVPTRAALLDTPPARLVYVSCEPQTLARDLVELGARYAIEKVAAFDLMPGTPEVETVVTLRKKD